MMAAPPLTGHGFLRSLCVEGVRAPAVFVLEGRSHVAIGRRCVPTLFLVVARTLREVKIDHLTMSLVCLGAVRRPI